MAAVELHARTIQPALISTQHGQPHRFPRPVFAPRVEPGVHALPGQGRAGKKLFNRQKPPLTAGFELIKQGLEQLDRVHPAGAPIAGMGQVGQNPGVNNIFGQDFHQAGERRWVAPQISPVLWESFAFLFTIGYFLNSFKNKTDL